MSKLKYGIIGAGNIAVSKHLTGYAALKDEVELVAVCDYDKEAAKRAAKQFGIPNVFTDYRNLLAMKEIDLVSVCTPNCLHAPVTIEALETGKHVHCEKPMTMNSEEAQEMPVATDFFKLLISSINFYSFLSSIAASFLSFFLFTQAD